MTNPEPPPDRLLDKADALMRRHRSFVAVTVPSPGDAVTASGIMAPPASNESADEDIPLLTEVVDDAAVKAHSAEGMLSSALTDQQKVIRAAIERWVDEALPEAILNVLDGFNDRLIAAVSERARNELLASLERDLGDSVGPKSKG